MVTRSFFLVLLLAASTLAATLQRVPISARNKRYSITEPCQPSPCGPNAKCEIKNGSALCSCLPGYLGAPPSCHNQCRMNVDCGSQYHCLNYECRDPCPGSCGEGASCDVVNHRAVCSCPPGKTGDPFIQCSSTPSVATNVSHTITNSPCHPSPCGPNSNCEITEGSPICKCLPKYVGPPPSCEPESGPCVLNTDCASQYACINSECRDPCPGVCGEGARCDVTNHIPVCACPEGMMGDPFAQCRTLPSEVTNPDTLSRERRQYFGQYSGSSSVSGVDGSGVPYGGGTYSVGSLGPQGFVGYTGNFGPSFSNFPNFVTPNLFPAVPYIANNPYDISSLYNAYFNALQAQQQNLQNQLIQLSSAPQVSTRQITLGPARPPITLPSLPAVLQPGSGQVGQLLTTYQQTVRSALCRALQRLQVSWAQTASVCSGLASTNQAGGGLFVSSSNSRPGGASISISAPPDAQIQPITGMQTENQGHLVIHSAHTGSSKPGGATISIISPESEEHQEYSEELGTRGQGLLTITKKGVSRPGGATITISAPGAAQIQQIKGPDGNVQGVTVTHQGPDNGGVNYVGSFSSSSSSSSTNPNGETQSQHASSAGINNNGLTTFISSHSR